MIRKKIIINTYYLKSIISRSELFVGTAGNNDIVGMRIFRDAKKFDTEEEAIKFMKDYDIYNVVVYKKEDKYAL